LKVAYLNPWVNAAENQAFMSLAAGGRNVGVELLSCGTAEEIERSGVDFVLSVASSVPKVADVPSYLTLHEPTKRFLTSKFYFENMLSYDGYLTISDSLKRFAQDVAFGIGRPDDVGFYYNTPQKSDFTTDVGALAKSGELKLVYLGTNWDQRLPALFKALDDREVLRVHGPEASWQKFQYKSFKGSLPFDGVSPQKAYSESGLGLVLLSDGHLAEDVISNRIFEISSVGAVSICPDTPWIRKWFGDSVFYFEPDASPASMSEQILEHHRFCSANPSQARLMGLQAREIFEEHFSAEKMLENAVRYHEKKQKDKRATILPKESHPAITVVVRCGGRPLEMVKSAVDSIRKQTFGNITVVFSKYADIDLSEITADSSGAIVGYKEVVTLGGNRSATLAAGLGEVTTPYFAILDDDDFWLSDHCETLFSAAKKTDPDFDCAFSGTISVSDVGTEIETNLFWKRTIYTFGFRSEPKSLEDVTREFSSNCFVAKSDLIPMGMSTLTPQETAEDSFIVAMVTRRRRPVFSFKTTAFFNRHGDNQSGYSNSPMRRADVLSCVLRSGLLYSHQWISSGSTQHAHEAWPRYGALHKADALRSKLGSPKVDGEYNEFWNVTPLLTIGDVGQMQGDGSIKVDGAKRGCVFFGPYLEMGQSRYRLKLHLKRGTNSLNHFPFKKRKAIGTLDVVCVDASWVGAAKQISANESQIICDFDVPADVVGKPIEFRLFSDGRENFTVASVTLQSLRI
jgi:Glycosyl transferase family 2